MSKQSSDHRNCRACHSRRLRLLWGLDSANCPEPVPVYRCFDCSHFSLFPDHYQDNKAFEWDGVDYYLSSLPQRQATTRQLLGRLSAAYQRQHGRNAANFLDVGCAIGHSLPIAQAHGLQAVGIEPEARLAAFGRQEFKADIRHGTLQGLRADIGRFDLVYCEQVLEHVADPQEFLGQLRGCLNTDGLLYIGVPPVYPLNRLATFLHQRFGLPLPAPAMSHLFHDPDEHINVFSRQSMQKMAQSCGLVCEVLPLSGSPLTWRRASKHLLTWGASPGTFLMRPA